MHVFKHYGDIETNVHDQYNCLADVRHVFTRDDGVRVSKDKNTCYIFHKERRVETVTILDDSDEWTFSDSVKRVKDALRCRIISTATKLVIFKEELELKEYEFDIMNFKLGSPEKPEEIINYVYEPEIHPCSIVYFSEYKEVNCIVHVNSSGSCRLVCYPASRKVSVQQCSEVASYCHSILKKFASGN